MRILKIDSLPNVKQWVDRDHIMLHACFQILQDCVEKENVDTHCNYEAHKDFPWKKYGTSRLSAFLRFWIISPRWLFKRVESENETSVFADIDVDWH